MNKEIIVEWAKNVGIGSLTIVVVGGLIATAIGLATLVEILYESYPRATGGTIIVLVAGMLAGAVGNFVRKDLL